MSSKVNWLTSARNGVSCLILVASFFGCAVVLGADNSNIQEPGWGKLLQVLAALGLIIGIIYGLAYALKRMRMLAPASTPVFTVMGTMAISPREKLYLVQVGQEQLVLGSSSKGLEALHVMQQSVPVPASGLQQASSFDGVLARFSREKF